MRAVDRRIPVGINEQLTAVPAEQRLSAAVPAARAVATYRAAASFSTTGRLSLKAGSIRRGCRSSAVLSGPQVTRMKERWDNGLRNTHSVTQAKAKMQRAPPGQPATNHYVPVNLLVCWLTARSRVKGHTTQAALLSTQSVGSLPSQLMLHARLSTPDPMTAVTMWAYAVSQPPVRKVRSVTASACSLPGSSRGHRWKLSCISPISQWHDI